MKGLEKTPKQRCRLFGRFPIQCFPNLLIGQREGHAARSVAFGGVEMLMGALGQHLEVGRMVVSPVAINVVDHFLICQ